MWLIKGIFRLCCELNEAFTGLIRHIKTINICIHISNYITELSSKEIYVDTCNNIYILFLSLLQWWGKVSVHHFAMANPFDVPKWQSDKHW